MFLIKPIKSHECLISINRRNLNEIPVYFYYSEAAVFESYRVKKF